MNTEIDVLEKRRRTVTICDHCSREVDDRGETAVECDFCSACSPLFVDADDPPADVLTTDDWTRSFDYDAYTPGQNVRETRYAIGAQFILTAVLFGIAAWYTHTPELLIGVLLAIGPWYIAHTMWRDFTRQYIDVTEDEL